MQLIKKTLLFVWAWVKLRFLASNIKSVLLVAEYGVSGGTRTYFISLLKFLKEEGYEVIILDNENLRDDEIETLVKQLRFEWYSVHFNFWGINFKKRPSGVTAKSMLLQLMNELLFWATLLNKIRCRHIVFSVGYPGLFIHSIILPVRFLYILHTPVTKHADKFTTYWLKCFLCKRKQILTVSNSARQDIFKFWFFGKDVKYVNYIHNYYCPQGNAIAIAEEYEKEKALAVLTIGSLEIYKNPFYFIEVAKKILAKKKDVKFVWAGDGSLIDICKNKVAHISAIQFIGNVNDVESLYRHSTVYFQPSLIEGHGIATIGAMCFGIPCVVSNNGGLKESVAHGINGYVVKIDNLEETSSLILNLLEQPYLCREMGAAGRYIYITKFSKDKWQKDMRKFYERYV